ncbi:GNAT family N-acetyltransferase [Saccharibacillus kuerlensis]|uniref:N-acetyltransferase n=1 Tax=Saccharibacillus kuerlensis TaxID=459527 RepID=A0ABQ2KRG8_9BACL|nr:GNAT family N-acetyltransferase [Saccharibacillus kuerlensis]GGN91086.1 N-acetyltransferase [Saccharibacillus kuerlensis]
MADSSKQKLSQLTVRRETDSEAEQLCELFGQLGYPTEPTALAARLRVLREHGDYVTLVAEQSDKLTGVITLHKEQPLLHDQSEIWVMALVVSENHRGEGIGGKLLKEAEKWASELGALYVKLNSGNRDERQAAHRFYRSQGYTAGSTGFSKRIQIENA